MAYHYVAENWTIGDFTCKLHQFLIYVTTYVTVYTLVAVAAVRVCKVAGVASASGSSNYVSSTNAGEPATVTSRTFTAFCCRFQIRFFRCGIGNCFPAGGWDSRSRRAVAIIVVVLWTAALVGNLPVLFLYRVKTTAEGEFSHYYQPDSELVSELSCTLAAPYVYCGVGDDESGRRISLAFFSLAYVAPLTSIATMYFRLLRQLRRKQRETSVLSTVTEGGAAGNSSCVAGSGGGCGAGQQQKFLIVVSPAGSTVMSGCGRTGSKRDAERNSSLTSARRSTNGHRRNSRVTRVLIVVVAVFAVCWLPLHIHLIVTFIGLKPTDRWYEIYRVLAQCLAYSNSCMNPVIYSYVSTDFKRKFADIKRSTMRVWLRACPWVCKSVRNSAGSPDDDIVVAGATFAGGGSTFALGTPSTASNCRPLPRRMGSTSSVNAGKPTSSRQDVDPSGSQPECARRSARLLSPPDMMMNRNTGSCDASATSTTTTLQATTAL
jgi:hypothetical protein